MGGISQSEPSNINYMKIKFSCFDLSIKILLLAGVVSISSCASERKRIDVTADNPSVILEADEVDTLSREGSLINIPSVSEQLGKKIVVNKETIFKNEDKVADDKLANMETPASMLKKAEMPAVPVARVVTTSITTEPVKTLSVAQSEPETKIVESKTEEKENNNIAIATVTPKTITVDMPEKAEKPSEVTELKIAENINAGTVDTGPVPEIPVSGNVVTDAASNASVGQCYGEVKTGALYKTIEEQVLVEPEKVNTVNVPAKYATQENEVVVKEETYKFVEIPATYKTITENVLVEPEKKEEVVIPATYKTIVENTMISPARKVWKKGKGLIQKTSETGGILCLVEEPAVYKDVEKQVMVTPERTEVRVIPAVYKTISKQVIDQPAKVEKIFVPAVTQKIQQRVLVEPEKTVTNKIPAVYKIVKKKVKVADEKVELRPVICERNINADLVYKLQTALAGRGYDIGLIDGQFGRRTADAVYSFQKSKGIESSGITFDTLQALNISM